MNDFWRALLILSSLSSAQEPPLLLPFTTTDQIVLRDADSRRTKVIPGVIEDLAGHSVVFRRSGNTVEVFKLRGSNPFSSANRQPSMKGCDRYRITSGC